MIRFLSFVVLLLIVIAGAVFFWQNHEGVTVHFWDWAITCSMAALLLVVYVLGMFSGWSILGLLRRSVYRVTQYQR